MAYSSARTRRNSTTENLDRHLKIDDKLGSHHKPVKIGEDITGLLLADKDVKIEGDLVLAGNIKNDDNDNLNVDNDLIVGGDLTITGNTLTFGNGKIVQNETANTVEMTTAIVRIDAAEVGSGNNAILTLDSSSSRDCSLRFDLAGAVKWLFSRDDDDSNTLKWDYGTATVGGSTMMSLTNGGNLTLYGDLAVNGDDITTDGNMNLDSGGSLTLDAHDGSFIAKKAGTEFSSANSAYAGMILGYTCIGLDEAPATYNLTTSYVVPTDELQVTFVAPPSGKVEIEVQVGMDVGSSNFGDLYAGLSTANATSGYSALEDFHEVELFDAMSRGALRVIRHSWTLTGLTAGTSYQYWAGFKSSSTSGTPHLQWGGNASGEYPDFIMKATALPNTIST